MTPSLSTLNIYLQHELEDYERRVEASTRGVEQPRTLPLIARDTVLYHWFVLDPRFGSRFYAPGTPKPWGGGAHSSYTKGRAGIWATHARRRLRDTGGREYGDGAGRSSEKQADGVDAGLVEEEA